MGGGDKTGSPAVGNQEGAKTQGPGSTRDRRMEMLVPFLRMSFGRNTRGRRRASSDESNDATAVVICLTGGKKKGGFSHKETPS